MVDFNNLNNMCSWERKKAMYLIKVAEELGMNTDGYGDLAVNPTSGYTYLWLEDYNFTLYMPISCDLQISDVWALYSCPYDGEEIEIGLTSSMTLEDLETWADEQRKKADNE